MAVLRQVTFRFPSDTQIRYVKQRPCRGDRVRGLDGELFLVLNTEQSESGDLATCVTPVEFARMTRRTAERVRERARAECRRAGDLSTKAVVGVRHAHARGSGRPTGTG